MPVLEFAGGAKDHTCCVLRSGGGAIVSLSMDPTRHTGAHEVPLLHALPQHVSPPKWRAYGCCPVAGQFAWGVFVAAWRPGGPFRLLVVVVVVVVRSASKFKGSAPRGLSPPPLPLAPLVGGWYFRVVNSIHQQTSKY